MSTPGSLDTTFGTNGLVSTNIYGDSEFASSVIVQPNGKIILVGKAENSNLINVFALVRYNQNGTLDDSFGSNGKVLTDLTGDNSYCESVALQSDGKIIVVGSTTINYNYDFALARYNENGTLDASFGTGGIVTTDFILNNPDTAYSVAIQSDGKIVLAGSTSSDGIITQFAMARYNSTGFLDGSFGSGGKVITDFSGNNSAAYSIALQNDGKIVLGGTSFVGNYMNFALARYNTTGAIDESFGSGGKVITDFSGKDDIGYSIAIQNDGKIVVGGTARVGLNDNFALARYNSNGTLDASFGTGGKVTTDFLSSSDEGKSILIQPDGKIILGGKTVDNLTNKFALVRYNVNGSLDSTFGTGGKVSTTFAGTQDNVGVSIAFQKNYPLNNIIIGGTVFQNVGSFNFALARYIGDAIPASAICFPAGTPILTDQGFVSIEQININKNTIRNKKIVAITKTTTIEKHIVCIEKDSFGPNIPSQKTFISRNHKVFYNKQMIKTKDLIGVVDGVNNKKYNGEILYNVLLNNHDKMIVNNLIVETLDPNNIVAKIYNGTLNEKDVNKVIENINNSANEYKKVYGKIC